MKLDEELPFAAHCVPWMTFSLSPVSAADSRVTKDEHRLQEAFNFDRREALSFVNCCSAGRGALAANCASARRMHHS